MNSIDKFSKIDQNFKGGLTFKIQPEDFHLLLTSGHVLTQRGSIYIGLIGF